MSDDDVDAEIQTVREENGYTNDDDWNTALTNAGYADADAYRKVVKDGLLQEALCTGGHRD